LPRRSPLQAPTPDIRPRPELALLRRCHKRALGLFFDWVASSRSGPLTTASGLLCPLAKNPVHGGNSTHNVALAIAPGCPVQSYRFNPIERVSEAETPDGAHQLFRETGTGLSEIETAQNKLCGLSEVRYRQGAED